MSTHLDDATKVAPGSDSTDGVSPVRHHPSDRRPRRSGPGPLTAATLAVVLAASCLVPGAGADARVESERCAIVAPAAEHRNLSGSSARIERLYRALFLRRPDPAGLDYWVNVLDSGRAGLVGVADLFATSPEFSARYGPLSDDEFVDLLYCNVLGRRITNDPGRGYWRDQLRAGLTRA